MIGEAWQPSLPDRCLLIGQSLIAEDVLGIWWGRAYSSMPMNFGTVVSTKRSLQNTLVDPTGVSKERNTSDQRSGRK